MYSVQSIPSIPSIQYRAFRAFRLLCETASSSTSRTINKRPTWRKALILADTHTNSKAEDERFGKCVLSEASRSSKVIHQMWNRELSACFVLDTSERGLLGDRRPLRCAVRSLECSAKVLRSGLTKWLSDGSKVFLFKSFKEHFWIRSNWFDQKWIR